jgi:Predicted solute binding protein
MAHGHHRHSRIGNLISSRRPREAERDEQNVDSDLLEDGSFQAPIHPATDILPDKNCHSKNSLCEHGMNQSDSLLEKRDETTSAEPTGIETVLQIVDASSQTPFQSTATDFPMTTSDSAYATDTLPSSNGLTATATAAASVSIDVGLVTSPTALPLPETSLSSSFTNSTQTSLTASTNSSELPSASRSPSATVINSPAWTSTRLIAHSSSTPSATTTSSKVHNYGSYSSSTSCSTPSSSSSSSSSTSSTSSTNYATSSSDVYGGSESTSSATGAGTAPTTSETQASGQGSTSNPNTPKIVGGVVGSVAGVALIILLLFYYLRRRGFFMGKTGPPAMLGDATVGAGATAESREIAERRESSNPLFTASYLAPAFMKRWRQSTATTRSGSTTESAPSERGFQKISGRKLPPVFTHGGDGYGGGLDGDSPTVLGFPATSPATAPIGSPSFYAPPPASQFGSPPGLKLHS